MGLPLLLDRMLQFDQVLIVLVNREGLLDRLKSLVETLRGALGLSLSIEGLGVLRIDFKSLSESVEGRRRRKDNKNTHQ